MSGNDYYTPCIVNFGSYKRLRMELPAKDVDDLRELNGRYLTRVRERVYEDIRRHLYLSYQERYPPFKSELWDMYNVSVQPITKTLLN